LNNIRQRLSIDDVEPNEDRTCFCRTSTASPGMLICCDTCEGWYHPKCVNLNSRKEMPAQWKCPMCANAHGVLDGRPSLHDLAGLTDKRWNLIIQPSELATLWTILDLAIEAGRVIVPLLRLVEPVRAPLKKRPIQLDDEGKEVDEEKAEMARVTHWCRKLYTMPINFDAVNNQRNERIVFEEWLFRRMRQARQPLMPTPPPEPPVVEIAPGQAGIVCAASTALGEWRADHVGKDAPLALAPAQADTSRSARKANGVYLYRAARRRAHQGVVQQV
jgi:histone demethylase JARID1